MPTTLPSHASMFTSRNPSQLDVLRNGVTVPAGADTLAERPRSRGYGTAAFVSAATLDAELGLDQGFDSYVEVTTGGRPEGRAADTRAAATAWIRDHVSEPFLCFAHLFDPHARYDPPAAMRERFSVPEGSFPVVGFGFLDGEDTGDPAHTAATRRAYDAEIASADAAIDALLDTLASTPAGERTIVVLVADHGGTLDELIDRYGYGFDHGEFLYRRELRVPLLLRIPAGSPFPPAGVHSEPVSTLDLLPTLAVLLGLPPDPGAEGRSLVPLLAGRSRERSPW